MSTPTKDDAELRPIRYKIVAVGTIIDGYVDGWVFDGTGSSLPGVQLDKGLVGGWSVGELQNVLDLIDQAVQLKKLWLAFWLRWAGITCLGLLAGYLWKTIPFWPWVSPLMFVLVWVVAAIHLIFLLMIGYIVLTSRPE